jgi:hypothetical protein
LKPNAYVKSSTSLAATKATENLENDFAEVEGGGFVAHRQASRICDSGVGFAITLSCQPLLYELR